MAIFLQKTSHNQQLSTSHCFAMRLLLPFLILLSLTTHSCREIPQPNDAQSASYDNNLPEIRYKQGDIKKLTWLAGAWKGVEEGRTLRQLFLFHDNNTLEIMDLTKGNGFESTFLTWYEGRYYFGPNREWAVRWIGEKDIRFDPVRPGVQPMTWTRQSDHQWLLVRHAPGQSPVLMERTETMQP